MSRFYFDVFDGRLHRDERGQELVHVSQVHQEVRRALADMVAHGHGPLGAILTVRDEDSKTILTASISLHFDQPETRH